jgi:iron(III) transport system ATP-binding protein
MTVFDNIAYPLRRRALSRADIQQKVGEVLDVVGLQEYARRSVVALSGGQMQRVALARALVYRPQILLLDEPLSNLDAKLRLRLRDDLRRIIKETGVTALYVTHDQAEAVILGDRIGVMQDGHLLQMTDPVQLYNRPANLFVANFTGASNAINGRVEAIDGQVSHVKVPTGEIVQATVPASIRTGDSATVAVRPENLTLTTNGANGSSPNRFPARVIHEQFQGTFSVYTVEALGTKLEVTELGTVPRLKSGAAVTLEMRPEHCWVFPNAG